MYVCVCVSIRLHEEDHNQSFVCVPNHLDVNRNREGNMLPLSKKKMLMTLPSFEKTRRQLRVNAVSFFLFFYSYPFRE